MPQPNRNPRLGLSAKAALWLRIWIWSFRVQVGVRRHSLPEFVRRLGAPAHGKPPALDPVRLGRVVVRVLRLGPYRARCLTTSLVLYRFLREYGRPAELVIGMPESPDGYETHAWVELAGRDVGPPPGRGHHLEMARYG